jgi:hypothetical protein
MHTKSRLLRIGPQVGLAYPARLAVTIPMQNPAIGRAIIGSVALLLLIGIVLRFTGGHSGNATTGSATSKVLDSATSKKLARLRDAPAPGLEANEPADADGAGPSKLPREKVEEYLRRNNRNAASLLAAFHAMDDTNYLNEAAANFPNDPQLQWTILARDAFPEDRRKWLDLFKASSPDNSLANYLSAADHFKNGQTDAAIKELLEASGKKQFKDHAMAAKLDEEELSRSAGRTPLESVHVSGWAGDLLPELAMFKGLARGIGDAQKQYREAGDSASANNLVQMEQTLAERLTTGEGGRMVISQLVGHAVEAMNLKQLDQNTGYDFLGGKTPIERLAELKQERDSLKELSKTLSAVYAHMTEAEMLGFSDRWKTYGEIEALRWLQQRFGTNLPAPNP